MIIINLVVKAKFFYIICKTLFVFLLTISKVEKQLLKLISNYFIIIEINKNRILYLYCFISFKKTLHLVILHFHI